MAELLFHTYDLQRVIKNQKQNLAGEINSLSGFRLLLHDGPSWFRLLVGDRLGSIVPSCRYGCPRGPAVPSSWASLPWVINPSCIE